MWEMQQLGRRAGALDIDLMSDQSEERRFSPEGRFCSGGVFEKRWKMFEGRAAQVDLISLLSTGKARGTKSLLRCSVLV